MLLWLWVTESTELVLPTPSCSSANNSRKHWLLCLNKISSYWLSLLTSHMAQLQKTVSQKSLPLPIYTVSIRSASFIFSRRILKHYVSVTYTSQWRAVRAVCSTFLWGKGTQAFFQVTVHLNHWSHISSTETANLCIGLRTLLCLSSDGES